MRLRTHILVLSLLGIAAPVQRLAAQDPQPPQSRPEQVPVGDSSMLADTVPSEDPTARNAFAKALIMPGWGHFSIGAKRRGMVFVGLQGTSWFMLIKTLSKLNRASDQLEVFEGAATDSLNVLIAEDTAAARRLADPLDFAEAVAANPAVTAGQSLVNSREEQRQDWITYTLFFTMASAVDAYVAANLRDFPVGISTSAERDGGFSLNLSIPVGPGARRTVR